MGELNIFSRFFLWVAGVDNILIHSVPHFERLKLVGFGVVMLIPAFLSFVSMNFLLSHYISTDGLIVLLAFIWAIMIFSIDRALILGIKKSSASVGLVFSRLLISIVLGYIISHPLVLHIFDKKITNHIQVSLTNEFSEKIDKNNFLTELPNRIEELNNNISIYNSAISNESNGIAGTYYISVNGKKTPISSSDDGGECGVKCKALMKKREELIKERNGLEGYLKKMRVEEDNFVKKNNDLSSKSDAMWDLIFKQGDISFAIEVILYLILFMIIDILAVMIKIISPMSLYDKLVEDMSNEFDYNGMMPEYIEYKEELFLEFLSKRKDKVKDEIIKNNKIRESGKDEEGKDFEKVKIMDSDVVIYPVNTKDNIRNGSILGTLLFGFIFWLSTNDELVKIIENIKPFYEALQLFCSLTKGCSV